MNEVKFPKRYKDGSFCIIVTFSVSTQEPEKLLDNAKSWLSQWSEGNKIWVRNWSNGNSESLYYQQEFKTAPHPIVCTSYELKVKLEGQPSSGKIWKDWLVLRIIPELKKTFAEIQDFKSAADCS